MKVNPAALRVIRERTGLTVTELAAAAGIGQAHLSLIESGRRNASPRVIAALADALRVTLPAIVASPAEVAA